MPAKYSAEELLVQPWSAVKYYAATGNEGECKDSDAVVIDYTPQPDVTKPCTPMPCFYGSYGYSTQSCVISSADGLRQLTSQYLGANKSYAQIDSWWWQNCSGSLFRVTHYELNACVASKADGDGSFSYKLEIDSSVLWNRRYSDPFCKKEIITASFRYNSTNGCPDTKLWESFYSVDILTTTTLENSLNLGSVIGGIVAGLLLAFGTGVAWYWKTRVGASQPIALPEETPSAVKETWDRDASEITLGISNAKSDSPIDSSDVKTRPGALFESMNEEIQLARSSAVTIVDVKSDSLHYDTSATDYTDITAIFTELKLSVNPKEWSVLEVSRWFDKLGASSESLAIIQKEEIDGAALLELSPEMLCKVLQIGTVGKQVKLKGALLKLKKWTSRGSGFLISQSYNADPPSYDAAQ